MTRLLIANRGEIACRIIRSARALGMHTIAVHSEADADALHAALADETVFLGGDRVADSYLNLDAIISAIKSSRADAVHPGYGLFSENADFARAVIASGAVFVGPDPDTIEVMGDKMRAREIARNAGLPVLPVSARIPIASTQDDRARIEVDARAVGFPLLVKAAGGGGGIGMRVADTLQSALSAVSSTQQQAERFFGSGDVYLERFVRNARHIEVQVLGWGDGSAIHLFERDCTMQRRFQKVIEEAPAPAVEQKRLAEITEAAVALASSQRYLGVGTVEFIYDADTGDYYFLEMNTRLQVEHPVTELVTGQDLVELQFLAAGLTNGLRPGQSDIARLGHSIECRIYAERPEKRFLPSTGTLERYVEPRGEGIRVDSGVRPGSRISSHYDPMIAKLIVVANTRDGAIARARKALSEFQVSGVETNIGFLAACLDHPDFEAANMTTRLIERDQQMLVQNSATAGRAHVRV